VNVQTAKAEMRSVIRAQRTARGPAEGSAAAQAVAEHGMALLDALPPRTTITAYLSLPSEPNVDPLIERADAAGHVVLVPRIEGRDLAWVAYRPGDPVRSGPLGIREPLGPAAGSPSSAGVMFLPGLAVGRDGCRLGQGGGYYDRVLADVPPRDLGGPLLVIVLFADEIVDAVPAEPHDRRVDAALTPLGLLDF
jgi:5-formyltetrahydrofolate cyclo-ligase